MPTRKYKLLFLSHKKTMQSTIIPRFSQGVYFAFSQIRGVAPSLKIDHSDFKLMGSPKFFENLSTYSNCTA